MSDVKILIADDHPTLREGLREIIDATMGFEVVGETGDGHEALELIKSLDPDVVLLDIELPGLNGIELTKKLTGEKSASRILVLSAHSDRTIVSEILALGASGYLLKDEVPTSIVNAIQGVAQGQKGWLSPKIAAQLSEFSVKDIGGPEELTKRELEVLTEMVTGATNQDIGHRLGISDKTVEKHLRSVYRKLDVESRVEAAVVAIEKQVVSPPKTGTLP